MVYEVLINKKYNYVKLFNIKRSMKTSQNTISKLGTTFINKYLLKKPQGGSHT
jgi:hypothetical protein